MTRPTQIDADRLATGIGCTVLGCLGLFAAVGLAAGYATARVLG